MAQIEETVLQPLGPSSRQKPLERKEREVESRASEASSAQSHSQQDRHSQADGGGFRQPLSSTVTGSCTASGTVSKGGSQQSYLKNLPRHGGIRTKREVRQDGKPGTRSM